MSDDGWEDDGWGEEGTDTQAAGGPVEAQVEEADNDGGEEPQDQEGGGRGGGDNKCRNCRQVR